jgi:hypothetical protein
LAAITSQAEFLWESHMQRTLYPLAESVIMISAAALLGMLATSHTGATKLALSQGLRKLTAVLAVFVI